MTGGTERPVRSIAVLGGGIVGLSAGLAFARALPQTKVSIVEAPANPAALADRLPGSWPSIARFHRLIGLDEAEVVRAGAASYRIGTRFDGWSADGAPWFHVHGLHGVPIGSIPFHEVWAQARRAGRALPYGRYAAAAGLAQAGKFVHPEDDSRSPLSTYDYGLRLDPQRYRNLLAALAARRGLLVFTAGLASVELGADGAMAALRLNDGRRLEADLFMDCSGPASALAPASDADFEDWSSWLPCDRLYMSSAPAQAPTSCDVVVGAAGGWRASFALPDRELRIVAGSARSSLATELSAGQDREGVEEIQLRPGRRLQPWRRNVLAIGDAAMAVDPLHGANLHLAHGAIHRALELLPGRDFSQVEIAEYNRRTAQEATLMRDFLALHYLLHPHATSLWGEAERPVPPDSLSHLLDQFGRRGRLPGLEDEPIGRESWTAALIGLGVTPRFTSPLAEAVDEQVSEALMRDLADGFASLPGQLPAYADYLSRAREMGWAGPRP